MAAVKAKPVSIKNAKHGEFVLFELPLQSYGHITASAYYKVKKDSKTL